ncbi:ABC transporter substrate-binding protein [Pseudomonas sp. 8AS]|uniref:substrate-binding periplasmic protein n=1 Tax=Pseudomonas sp. 8AS TaxID=2653163 RepID=UPI0012F29C0E|nr:transporter substrate-binding domain-containing protein [Pseudomonas sp. 8AS]VXB23009.1 ABC transporter substrate-binding protein [Pseudomonas sp. 8AS]
MRAWLLAGLLIILGLPAVQAAEGRPREILLVSERWPGHTNADGSGLAWEIMRLVFEPAGVKMTVRIEPYTRALGLVQRGEADAWLGSYRDEVKERTHYPRWPYDADRIVALGLSSRPPARLAELGGYRLAWMRGYGYQQYLPGIVRYHEVQRSGDILAMLERGHADFYIDASTEVADILRHAETERFRISALTRLPLYPGFADTARGRALAALYDRRMAVLVNDGSLRPLFRRWRQPYPFDQDMERPDASP